MSTQQDGAELQPFREDSERVSESKAKEDSNSTKKKQQKRVVLFIIIAAAVVLVVIALIVVGVVLGLMLNQSGDYLELVTKGIENEKSTLIRFDQGDKNTFKKVTSLIQGVIKEYEADASSGAADAKLMECNSTTGAQPGKSCIFNVEKLGEKCTPENGFGYPDGMPCVLLRFSAPMDWTPEPFASEDWRYNEMIKQLNQSGVGQPDPRDIPVTCKGLDKVDSEFLRDSVQYWPERGFEGHYFPRTGVEGYMNPLVMVQFKRPTVGVVILVECTAWAKNIPGGKDSVRFEMLIH